MADPDAIINPIKTTLKWLVSATVALYLVVIGVGAFTYTNAQQNHDALCSLRADLERRVEQTQQFVDHPEQFPDFNDPKTLALIEAQLENQRATIAALGDLSC